MSNNDEVELSPISIFLIKLFGKKDTLEQKKNKDRSRLESELQNEARRDVAKAAPKVPADIARKLSKSPAEQKRRKKKVLILGGIVAVIGLLSYGTYWLFKPYQGGIGYGVCKVFIELYVPYPTTIQYSGVTDNNDNVRVWFTHIDPFGEYRLEDIRCYYGPDEKMGFKMVKAEINRREIDQDIVDRFNVNIPIIRAYPPDLSYPPPFASSLQDLQVRPELYMRRIF